MTSTGSYSATATLSSSGNWVMQMAICETLPVHVFKTMNTNMDNIMRGKNTNVTRAVIRMLTGDPLDAMESAKKLISAGKDVDTDLLGEVASNERYKLWSRIAAVYALGFLGNQRSGRILIHILGNQQERLKLRSHAAEALGNLKYGGAVVPLQRVVNAREPASIKRWCVYALAEIGSARAFSYLKKLQEAGHVGVVAQELKLALRNSS